MTKNFTNYELISRDISFAERERESNLNIAHYGSGYDLLHNRLS